MPEITQLLDAAAAGDRYAAAQILPLVYDELRKLAAAKMTADAPGHTLNVTALVHEAYLRLIGDQAFECRSHFFAAAAEAMRRILVNHARDRKRQKRGGGRVRVELLDQIGSLAEDPDLVLSLDDLLAHLGLKDEAAGAGRPPSLVRRTLRRGGGRGDGDLSGGRLPELEVRPSLAPRGPGKNNFEIRETIFARMGH